LSNIGVVPPGRVAYQGEVSNSDPSVVATVVPTGLPAPDPVQIKFKGMDTNKLLEAEVRAWLQKLAPLTAAARVSGGLVVVEAAARNLEGWAHHARIELRAEGGPIVVGPDHAGNAAHEDAYIAVRNAFRGLRRLLEARAQAAAGQPEAPIATAASDTPGAPAAAGPLV
jgi:hypothetical protein